MILILGKSLGLLLQEYHKHNYYRIVPDKGKISSRATGYIVVKPAIRYAHGNNKIEDKEIEVLPCKSRVDILMHPG